MAGVSLDYPVESTNNSGLEPSTTVSTHVKQGNLMKKPLKSSPGMRLDSSVAVLKINITLKRIIRITLFLSTFS